MQAGTTTLSNATVLVGSRLEPTRVDVVIGDGRIVALGEGPADSDRLDLAGMTLLPGFIDSHVHIGFADPLEVLRGGVTTVRDLAWPPEIIFPMAQAMNRDPSAAPRVLAAGPMLTTAGGYPTEAGWAPPGTARVLSDPADAAAAVRTTVADGADVIKVALNAQVGPTLDLPTLRAVVEEAHRAGLKVTGHVYGLAELDKALDAGMDELAHMLMSDEPIPDPTIERMVAAGMAIVPTLSVRSGRDLRTAIDNLSRFIDAGGTVIYGTDLGNEGPRPGIDPLELAAMLKSGMDGRGVIASATVEAARWLGLARTGRIEVGMTADLIATAGDPLASPDLLLDVPLVIHEGIVIKGP